MLKYLGEDGVTILCEFLYEVYEKGKMPDEMTKLMFIPLPKKNGNAAL